MHAPYQTDERQVVRRVFPTWSIEMPETFTELFVEGDGYWHAYDETRSISLSSIVVTDGDRSVTADELASELGSALVGTPVEPPPTSLAGHAVISPSIPPARASMLLSGLLAVDGRLLLVTVTSDDLEWARHVWHSIRSYPESGGRPH